ncbi:MAG: CHAT domain-containing protein, partial [Desulfamplus sp.]|nr:CHAT domain-containing protein [Desulfamplus sp.]
KSGDAINAAIAIQKSLYEHNQTGRQSEAIHVKIGIHHGEVLVDGEDIFGDAVNLAARIQSLAGSDEILLSQNIHDKACELGKIDCSFLGAVHVKGKTEPQNIYKVLWSDEQKKRYSPVQVRSVGARDGVKDSKDFPSSYEIFNQSLLSNMEVASIHIDISKVGDNLTLSCFEESRNKVGTVRVYEEIEFKAEHISDLCSSIVNTLNLVNRRGVFPSDCVEKLRQSGQELQIALLTPKIMDMLSNTEADHLILLIDESAVHIPWELIHDGKEFLCLKFSMGRIVKTKQNLHSHQARKVEIPLKMLIIADPEKNLEGAANEGKALEEFFLSNNQIVNSSNPKSDVTTKFLLNHLHYYDWVHFAGHAQYDVKNPEMNGWSLADKVLYAKDIIEISQNRAMPALEFSNACQSAR